jgi:hypothetical protein
LSNFIEDDEGDALGFPPVEHEPFKKCERDPDSGVDGTGDSPLLVFRFFDPVEFSGCSTEKDFHPSDSPLSTTAMGVDRNGQ